MTKKILLSIFILFQLFYVYSQAELNMLDQAYQENSNSEMKAFLHTWSKEYPPMSDEELATYNDTIINAYNVFISFYDPIKFDSLTYTKRGRFYEKFDFWVVQNKINIYFLDVISRTESEIEELVKQDVLHRYHGNDSAANRYMENIKNKRGKYYFEALGNLVPEIEDKMRILTNTITDFRPNIHFNEKTPLFLSEKYINILNSFIVDCATEKEVMKELQSRNPIARIDYLKKYLCLRYAPWHRIFPLFSMVNVKFITFDKHMQVAQLYIETKDEDVMVIMEKEDDAWRLVSYQVKALKQTTN